MSLLLQPDTEEEGVGDCEKRSRAVVSVCFKEPLKTELLLKTIEKIHQKTPPGPGFQPW